MGQTGEVVAVRCANCGVGFLCADVIKLDHERASAAAAREAKTDVKTGITIRRSQ